MLVLFASKLQNNAQPVYSPIFYYVLKIINTSFL